MEKYQKLKNMDAKKWLSENCPHLDKTSQKIGLYELCLVMEEYHKYKAELTIIARSEREIKCDCCDKDITNLSKLCMSCAQEGF